MQSTNTFSPVETTYVIEKTEELIDAGQMLANLWMEVGFIYLFTRFGSYAIIKNISLFFASISMGGNCV